MAQLVNVIAPIMTSDTGAWRQTIFILFPCFKLCQWKSIKYAIYSPKYDSKNYTDVPYLDAVIVENDEKMKLLFWQ